MQFDLNKTLEILERTPRVLEVMLGGLSEEWTNSDEGPETWSAYDVMGHLIHGEKSDWIPRMEIILSEGRDKRFEPFDRFAQFHESQGKSLHQLLEEFKQIRERNIQHLRAKNLSAIDFAKTGIHPAFGEVTLSQLLSTWTVHDMNHIAQIARVMGKQYTTEVGPWKQYLGILKG